MRAPIVGWIADARCGNYRVFRVGASLLFLATVICCICVLILFNVPPHSIVSRVVSGGISPIMYIVGFVGGTACLVTALQLGLDQMPDASSANITSFISWFVFSLAFGAWIFDTGCRVFSCIHGLCAHVFSLVPVIAMSVLCCSLFLLTPKWMIIEPNCPQSLKTIYQVLKFAAKHKAPLNRSALTYWEEDIPSRMDLGKSRYGGPFTTEEVEDVKTFFKILIISVPIFIISCSLSPEVYMQSLDGFANCEAGFIFAVTYSPTWVIIIVTLVYEFCIYPLLRNRLPSILKRIGIISSVIFIVSSVKLVLATAIFSYSLDLSPWSNIAYFVIFSSIFMFLLTSILEFICAQSPYKMRGLLLGYTILLYIISMYVGTILMYIFNSVCVGPYCHIFEKSVFTALSLVGFVLHCLLATWYKRRVREEDYDVHRVVEEVYDRYLSQRPTL
ncbi:solute carrier family 15 member 4-like [Halichondria panicea]|uniref:solute carrier family 15 member 4-like n=1 Tax=Halichondria panicea TaxID=6063 RepID=UPI00312B70E3